MVYIYVSLWGKQDATHTNIFFTSQFSNIMNQTKTVIQHLAQAIVDGHPWAQAAMENYFKLTHTDGMGGYWGTLYMALQAAFRWKDTKEGFDFWENIHKSLK